MQSLLRVPAGGVAGSRAVGEAVQARASGLAGVSRVPKTFAGVTGELATRDCWEDERVDGSKARSAIVTL